MIVEVEIREKLRNVRFALVVNDVSMLLRLEWMSVKVVEERKMMMALKMGRVEDSKAARHLM